MKITKIEEVVSYDVYTEDNNYTRYSDGSWSEEQCFDIVSEIVPVEYELEKQLEELYQEYIGAGYMSEDDCADLYDADPNCKHKYDPNCYSGIRCSKCNGWYCL